MNNISEIYPIIISFAVGIFFVVLTLFVFASGGSYVTKDYHPTPVLFYEYDNIMGYEQCVDDISGMQFEVRGTTINMPYDVRMVWNTERFKTESIAEFTLLFFDKQTGEPLSDVTYDFTYKGARDLGVLDNRNVANFEDGPDRFELLLKYPCDLHTIIHIDRVGQQSFLPGLEEIEKGSGNVSKVAVEFRVIQTPTGRFGMMTIDGESVDVDSAHPDIPSVSLNRELNVDVWK